MPRLSRPSWWTPNSPTPGTSRTVQEREPGDVPMTTGRCRAPSSGERARPEIQILPDGSCAMEWSPMISGGSGTVFHVAPS